MYSFDFLHNSTEIDEQYIDIGNYVLHACFDSEIKPTDTKKLKLSVKVKCAKLCLLTVEFLGAGLPCSLSGCGI